MINNINNLYKNSTSSTTHQLYSVVRGNISYLVEDIYPVLVIKDPKYARRVKKFIENELSSYIERNENNPLLTSYDKHENMLKKVIRRITKFESLK